MTPAASATSFIDAGWKPSSPNTWRATSSSCSRRRAAGRRDACGRASHGGSVALRSELRTQRGSRIRAGRVEHLLVRPPKQTPAMTARRPPEPFRPLPARKLGVSLLSVQARRRRFTNSLPPRRGRAEAGSPVGLIASCRDGGPAAGGRSSSRTASVRWVMRERATSPPCIAVNASLMPSTPISRETSSSSFSLPSL